MFFLIAIGNIRIARGQEDLVEFLTGAKLTGKVLAIRVGEKEFDFESTIGTKSMEKTYSFGEVHAVTIKGKRHELTPKGSTDVDESGGAVTRTQQEVLDLIEEAGATKPKWFDKTMVDYPPTLDLSWPLKPPKGWNNKKNVGQFFWDIVNPNPSRWNSAVKLVHQIMAEHEGNATLYKRDCESLGRMYFVLLQDYARSAYWLQKANVSGQSGLGVKLAESYFRLGNRKMALDLLTQRTLPISAIKLLAELGEIKTALRLAAAYEGSGNEWEAMILAGDALRNAGRNEEATAMYQKAIDSDRYRNEDYKKRNVGRARESIEAIRLAEKADPTKVADGKYRASSIGYNGQIEVEVSVAGGKIQDLQVLKHNEKQFYSALEDTPAQITARQTVKDIDGFSGATITSAAIVNATAKALAQGAK